MTIYFTTIGDLVKNQKTLASLPGTDHLYILYTEKEASIPIDAYTILSGLKCKVEFKQFPDKLEEQFKFVYDLGVACGENKNTAIRSLSNTGLPFMSIFQKEKPVRKRVSSAGRNTKVENKEEEKPEENSLPDVNPVQKTEDVASPPEKKKRGRKSKQDEAFDKAYDELIALFEQVKTKSFDPTAHVYGIVKAVKASISEGTELSESFKVWFPNNANKFIKTFTGKEDELIKIVNNLNDEKN